MAFTPKSTVYLLDTPLDNKYKNQLYFATSEAQYTYFHSKIKHTFDDVTYQRKDNYIPVKGHIDFMWDSNYVMYQNAQYGYKWFYAFITKMEYVNDYVTNVYIETDVYQTWLTECSLLSSFVVREHTADDVIGNHIISEGLECGDYITNTVASTTEIKELAIIVATTCDSAGNKIYGDTYGKTYSGLAYYGFNDFVEVNYFISPIVNMGKPEAIVAIFMMPKALIPSYVNMERIAGHLTGVVLDASQPKYRGALNGYTPKNNKMYCFPYNYMLVTNNKGGSNILKYEYAQNATVELEIRSNISPSSTTYLTPINYNGVTSNYDEGVTLDGYPVCPWTTDIYTAWLAQNVVTNSLSVASSALALGVGMATANPIAIAGGAIGVAQTLGSFYEKSLLPAQSHGVSSGNGNVAIGSNIFTFHCKSVRSDYAKMLDNYFTMFGYKVNVLKVPNIHVRPHWTYTQTIDVNIDGAIPTEDMQRLKKMYDEGITFWKSALNFCNYSLDNSI